VPPEGDRRLGGLWYIQVRGGPESLAFVMVRTL
jgi:hypothetical protein